MAQHGRLATAEEIAAWNLNIGRDGRNLPTGNGSVPEGREVYAVRCAHCHGDDGQDARLPLAGGIGSLRNDVPLKTVGSYWPYATTLFDYTRRAMPYDSPKSLSDNEVYAVVAYMLALNGIVADNASLDAASLSVVRMPNRDGFIDRWHESDR